MEAVQSYVHYSAQKRRTSLLRGSWKEDKLCISLRFYKRSGWRSARGDPVIWDDYILIAGIKLRVKFSHFKQHLRDNKDSNREYSTPLCEHLKSLGVPECEHVFIVEHVFRVVEAAVSPLDPVVMLVVNLITYQPSSCKMIPASRSSIQGLEPVAVPDTCTSSFCDICLDDYEQKPITRLPCTHHFHLHCITRWLEMNHTCPLCRYPMPTEEDQLSPAIMPTQADQLCPPIMPTQGEDQLMPTQEEDQLSPAIDSGSVLEVIWEPFIMFLWCLIAICLLAL